MVVQDESRKRMIFMSSCSCNPIDRSKPSKPRGPKVVKSLFSTQSSRACVIIVLNLSERIKQLWANHKASQWTRNGGERKPAWSTSFHFSVLTARLQGSCGEQTDCPPSSCRQVLLVGVRFCPRFIWFESHPRSLLSLNPPFHSWLGGACTASHKPLTVERPSPNPSVPPAAKWMPCCSTGCKPAAASEQTWKKTHKTWWLYFPFQPKRNTHA